MRIIENSILNTTSSPAKAVFAPLHNALVNIAPEHSAEFDRLYPAFTLEYVDSNRWIVDVIPDKKHIRFSTFAMEFLWSSAFAHFRVYNQVFQGRSFKTRTEISLLDNPLLEEALHLLKWAVEKMVNQSEEAWPTGFPSPNFHPGFATDEDVADEFALGAAAVLVHHELAHIVLQHAGGSEIESEKDADAHAWDWIIGHHAALPEKQVKKRLLLLVHAYIVGVARDVHLGHTTLRRHPRSIDRLFSLLARYNLQKDHVAYAFAFASIYLHLENSASRMPVQTAAYDSFFESFDATIEHIANFPTITG